jgi:hypothetical protein
MIVRRLIFAAVFLAAAVAVGSCSGKQVQGPNPSTVSDVFDSPPPYPGYQWTRYGQPVATAELGASAGPQHCDWQTATVLTIGWPLGTVANNRGQSRSYIRDPNGAIQGTYKQRLVKDAQLPAGARPTGYKLGSIEIYLSPVDQDQAIYLVTSVGIERWPRADPFFGCQ